MTLRKVLGKNTTRSRRGDCLTNPKDPTLQPVNDLPVILPGNQAKKPPLKGFLLPLDLGDDIYLEINELCLV
ncbi:MAG TPA: hypothetical protein DCY97_12835 [Marinilabiliales bacterium]|nr:MAG: hypothetical protein A2W89_09840 [Bacteroidetes bacterium GWE2_42_39]HAZ03034.1 hypothetical protein [Marinilabiliales bacterium]